jgi:formylglycine-generating enzyme required for sulfatase activity
VVKTDYVAACEVERLAQRRRRRVQALVGVLGVVMVLGSWLNQSYSQERINGYGSMRPYMLAQIQPYVLTEEAERALKPKDSFRECAKDCPKMIVVQDGEFIVGSPGDEKGRVLGEGPQHRVVFAKPFAVSKFEVTFEQWDACVGIGACAQASDSGYGRGDRPVINVSWNDAKQYAAWLSRITGKEYRLLTEAEWEYAARAGTTTTYPWGDDIGKGNADCADCDNQTQAAPAPVGSFKPNAFGLYEMYGNVWEWVEDPWHNSYEGSPTDGSPWLEDGNASRRVVRGGSWISNSQFLRAASRFGNPPGYRDIIIGFRLARTLNP